MQVQTLCLNHLHIRYLDLFRISIFGFRIYHTLNVHNVNSYRVESVPGSLDPGIYYSLSFFENKYTNNSVTAVFSVFRSLFFPFKSDAITDLISCHTSGRAVNEEEMV